MPRTTKEYLSLVDSSTKFKINSPYKPAGDQPKAIEQLLKNIAEGCPEQVLLGVTGSGKTFTMANIIAELNRPALVLAHNKTLAAQLYSEFKDIFPENAVKYFVSYYDYYQPEAYVPATNTYIEKDASINDEIDKLRHGATKSLLERRDVIVVASVSCIYGLGAPENYFKMMLYVEQGEKISRKDVLRKLVEMQFERSDLEFNTGTFRVRGDVVEICPASEDDKCIRLELFGDEIEEISEIDRLSGNVLRKLNKACIYPASHFVTDKEDVKKAIKKIRDELKDCLWELNSLGKIEEAQRLEQRTLYDLELLQEMGFCSGIENYSRHLTGREEGEPPPTLIDYFPDDFLVFVDESHVTIPQLVGMYRGDRSRKQTLVNYGFRLPSAVDNRPLKFEEYQERVGQTVYVSATPAKFELQSCAGKVVEQIIRPTGLIDPVIEIRPATNQVDDFLAEVNETVARGERVLVTTLTKKMSEKLTDYYREAGVRVKYLHSDVHTLDRIELIRGLREGEFDLLVGINLLREGLDLPEVSLVGVMDADKEGFLRSETSLIQTIGRAARHINGRVILYADKETKSIKYAISETDRRRKIQSEYNKVHGITPRSTKRSQEATFVSSDEISNLAGELADQFNVTLENFPKDFKGCKKIMDQLRNQIQIHAKDLEFEKAAVLRDQMLVLEKYMLTL